MQDFGYQQYVPIVACAFPKSSVLCPADTVKFVKVKEKLAGVKGKQLILMFERSALKTLISR